MAIFGQVGSGQNLVVLGKISLGRNLVESSQVDLDWNFVESTLAQIWSRRPQPKFVRKSSKFIPCWNLVSLASTKNLSHSMVSAYRKSNPHPFWIQIMDVDPNLCPYGWHQRIWQIWPKTSKFCPGPTGTNLDRDWLDRIWPNSVKFCTRSRQLNQIRLNLG